MIMGKDKDKEKQERKKEDVGVEANPPWRPIDCWGSHRSLQAAPSISAHTLSHLQLFAHQHTHHHRDDNWSSQLDVALASEDTEDHDGLWHFACGNVFFPFYGFPNKAKSYE